MPMPFFNLIPPTERIPEVMMLFGLGILFAYVFIELLMGFIKDHGGY
jgi:hypothetical protein